MRDAQFRIYKRIQFFDEHEIPEKTWKSAEELLKDIDPDDTAFLVLTKHLRGTLWSGDRTLVLGLRKKGFTKIITTSELLAE